MARTRKKSRKIQFQVSWGGLIALIVSAVCVFMWIFILGFWVGQKLVGRSLDESLPTQVVARAVSETGEVVPAVSEKTKVSEDLNPDTQTAKERSGDTSDVNISHKKIKKAKKRGVYFVLQIASCRERDRANKEAGRWRDKGYRAEVRRVDLGPEKGIWYRVHLGEFRSAEEATSFAEKLAQKHNLKSYIVPVSD
jgi:DedD protein